MAKEREPWCCGATRGLSGSFEIRPLSRYSESLGPLAPTADTDRLPGQEGKVRKLSRGLSGVCRGRGVPWRKQS